MRKTEYIKNLLNTPKSPLALGFFACLKDPSIINLGTAENRLISDLILPLIQSKPDFTPYDLTYPAGMCSTKAEKAICELYKDHFGIPNAEPGEFVFGSGISFLVEKIGLVLCEPGDVVLIPKPCYGCFEPDLQQSRCKVEYIDLNHLPEKPNENARLLILTNPGNPLGNLIESPEKVLEWAYQNENLHIVTDDIYALSNREGKKYQSIAGLKNANPQKVHQFYGLSKDWGLAGFNVGIFWSKNKEMVDMMKTANGCAKLSSETNYILNKLWSNKELRDKIISESQKRHKKNYELFTGLLKENGIEYIDCENSLFIMVNLNKYANTPEKEMELFKFLYEKHKIHILPGYNGFKYETPGWFRVCFSFEESVLREGVKRLKEGLNEFK
ncbi:MAG: pyridoxal phosphate-dependent aminotransferase [archaeon]|nr:pyridoxal phosphate-dependent aminotransferase [archaeon]